MQTNRCGLQKIDHVIYDIYASPLEFPLQNGDPGAHHFLENSFHIFSQLDYLHSLETYLYNFDLV